jgi:chromosomal replication initiation ATPase DnaA
MSYAAELHAARKERLARLGAGGPRTVKELNQVTAEQVQIITEISNETVVTDVVADWVKRQKEITRELRASVKEGMFDRPTVAAIQSATARYFGITRDDILSARRGDTSIAHPRQVAYYLCKTLTLRSLPDIGRKFGGRDHTTILHGVRKIEKLVRLDWETAYDVAQIEATLR